MSHLGRSLVCWDLAAETHLLLTTLITGPFHRLSSSFFANIIWIVNTSRGTFEASSSGSAFIDVCGMVMIITDGHHAGRIYFTSHYRVSGCRSIINIHCVVLEGLLTPHLQAPIPLVDR